MNDEEQELYQAALRECLYAYTIKAFEVIEPATEFEDNWHIECIAEHLEASYRGEIRDLIINVPPRTLK